jgi:hypothetical protein
VLGRSSRPADCLTERHGVGILQPPASIPWSWRALSACLSAGPDVVANLFARGAECVSERGRMLDMPVADNGRRTPVQPLVALGAIQAGLCDRPELCCRCRQRIDYTVLSPAHRQLYDLRLPRDFVRPPH